MGKMILTVTAILLTACSANHEEQPAPAPKRKPDVIACFCPERSAHCGSWHATTGTCREYRGHSVVCDETSCDCGCEPDSADSGAH